MAELTDRPLIYRVTQRWLETIARGGALFVPDGPVWRPETIDALNARIVDDPQTGTEGFQDKLLHQVHREGPAAQRLAAEAMFVFHVKDASALLATKRGQIDALLRGLDPPVSVPEDLAAGMHYGMAAYGSGRMRSLADYLYVLRFARRWAITAPAERGRLLADPWAFRALADELFEKDAVFAREATKHLVHPATFEPIAAMDAKRKILRVLGGTRVRDSELDEKLLDLRREMERDGGAASPGFRFYDPDIRPMWNPKPGGEGDGPDPDDPAPPEPGPIVPSRLRLDAVADAADERHLRLPQGVLAALVAALNSDKHVILTGAPGTAKTTLAELVASEARKAGRCTGHVLATATADWSTYETVGGYRPTPDGRLEFAPGLILQAIDDKRWLVLDEMNRANTDRALGPLFTVLSGQAVTIAAEEAGRPVRIRPESVDADDAFTDHVVPANWRIIATTNVLDRALLFDLSFALMRRFAFVEVGCPTRRDYEELVHDAVADVDTQVAARAEEVVGVLLALTEIRPLGPALFRDAATFVASYVTDRPGATRRELLLAAFHAYLLPQFEGVDEPEAVHLRRLLVEAAGRDARDEITALLHRTLGVFAAERFARTPNAQEDSDDE